MVKLFLDGFKGQYAEHFLGRINVFLGPNGSGKSSRLEAVRFLLSGETGEAKTNQELYRLYHPAGKDGAEIKVGLEVVEGAEGRIDAFERRLAVTKKGAVNQEVTINQGKAQSGTSAKSFFSEKFMSPEDFDLGHFFGLSDERKKSLLLSLVGSGKSLDVFRTMIREKLSNTEIRSALDGRTDNVEALLTGTLDRAVEILNGLRAEHLRHEKTAATSSETKVQESAPVEDLDSLTKERERVNKEYLETAKQLAKIQGTIRSAAKYTEDLKTVEARIKALQPVAAKVIQAQNFDQEIHNREVVINECKGRLQFIAMISEAFGSGQCPFGFGEGVKCPVNVEERLKQYKAEEETTAETIGTNKAQIDEIKQAKRRHEIEDHEVEQARAELTRQQEQYKELEKKTNEIKDGAGDPDALGVQADGLEADLEKIESRIKSAILAREAGLLTKKSLERMTQIEPEIEAAKFDIETLKAERSRIIMESIGPVESTINEILKGIDPAFRFSFFREDRFELVGVNAAGATVNVAAMSGGEKAAYYAALLLALLNVKRSGCRILLSDMSELDGPSLGRFVRALQQHRDRFDLAFVASWYMDAEITTDAETVIVPLKRKETAFYEGTKSIDAVLNNGAQAEMFEGVKP